MSIIETLCREYEKVLRLRWGPGLSGEERVWMVVYESALERRLRARIGLFENATKAAGHDWRLIDIRDSYSEWISTNEYRDTLFATPKGMDSALNEYRTLLQNRLNDALMAEDVNENTVVAVLGLGSLFGLVRVSELISSATGAIRGSLLAFFPGQHEGSNYRLLDARDGWNYLAIPITAGSRE